MCGIALLFSCNNPLHLNFIKPMSDIIRHRGPDDEGFAFFSLEASKEPYLYGGIDSPKNLFHDQMRYSPKKIIPEQLNLTPYSLAFGHRRLSIVDISVHGHQPMSNTSGRLWITYNGEIYNYIELRKELNDLGHSFHTQTDTEVILHAYEEWGEQCLEKFNGMFAFVIYDRQENCLFAARDRFAVKPIYYWFSPEGFVAIASEIKQFTLLPGWNPIVNGQAAYDFINWGLKNNTSETCFKNVYQLQGGYKFRCKLQPNILPSIKPEQWYQLPIGEFFGSIHEAGEKFADLLKDSVKIRCRADVSLGSCLSGGLDSSSIVCLIHSILNEHKDPLPQKTFSACSHFEQFNEREYIEEVMNHTNVRGHFTYPNLDGLLEQLENILWHQDEPFGTTSIFAQWEVFNLVKQQNVKVMLDGQGADEQLAGYTGFFSMHYYDLIKKYRLFTLFKEMRLSKKNCQIEHPLQLVINQLLPEWIKQPLRRKLKKTTIVAPWLNQNILQANERDPNHFDNPAKGKLQSLCYSQTMRTSLPMLLHFEDRDSMAHSIEARTPFLDYRLVEFITSLPAEYKLSNGLTKQVLREGMKGVLPEKIRTRTSKLGFATPEEIWIREHQPEFFREMLRESITASQGILNEKAFTVADDIISGRSPFSFLLWRMIIFGRWMKQFSINIK